MVQPLSSMQWMLVLRILDKFYYCEWSKWQFIYFSKIIVNYRKPKWGVTTTFFNTNIIIYPLRINPNTIAHESEDLLAQGGTTIIVIILLFKGLNTVGLLTKSMP